MNRRLSCLVVLMGLATFTLPVTVAAGTVPPPPRIVYTYDVRGLNNVSALNSFAAQAAQNYADPRGWSLGGSIAFRQVSSGGEFTLWLSAAAAMASFGAPCDSAWSCTTGGNVVINETRWLTASPAWNAYGQSLADYRHLVLNHETGHWLGFGHHFCAGAGQLAPVMQQQSIDLQGCRPNPWPLPWERQQLAASRGVPIRTGNPIGSVDVLAAGPDTVRVSGWAIDPDTVNPIHVDVYIDARGTRLTASRSRPDVARAFPAYGPNHGFTATIPAPSGRHHVCVYAINAAGAGSNIALTCEWMTIGGSPFGHVDVLAAGPGTVRVSGWAIDPDTVGPIHVDVYIDAGGTRLTASLSRPDVARVFPAYGPNHGFAATIPAQSGRHHVCAYAINAAGLGGTVRLECAWITVP